jgi:Secretion system C-terminal sorting domain
VELPLYNSWYFIDSVKNEIIFHKERSVFYINNHYPNAPNVIWIEGIGSLAGLLYPEMPPSLDWLFSGGHLTCCYDNDTLIYQSEYGELYGCSFEYLDIGELSNKPNIRIYPNPINDNSVIDLSELNNQKVIITVYDAFGRLFSKMQTNKSLIEFNELNLKSEIYFINIQTENKSITKKIIKL